MFCFLLLLFTSAACAAPNAQVTAKPSTTLLAPSPESDFSELCHNAETVDTVTRGRVAKACLLAGDSAKSDGDLNAALALFERGCKLGAGAGCFQAGGLQIESDHGHGLDLLTKGCELGESGACFGAAFAHSGAFGGAVDDGKAAAMFGRGCDLGLADACGKFGAMLIAGVGVEADPERGRSILGEACSQGERSACLFLGFHFQESDDPERAIENFRGACNLGEFAACELLPSGGRTILVKACGRGEGAACTRLGLIHAEGRGVDASQAEAERFFRRGCDAEQIDQRGCAMTGWAFWNRGGDNDQAAGLSLLEKSCDLEDALGCAYWAIAESQRGRTDRAGSLVRRACDLDPVRCSEILEIIERELER
jgi:uncharacterized protein